jgi:hypothetical protein
LRCRIILYYPRQNTMLSNQLYRRPLRTRHVRRQRNESDGPKPVEAHKGAVPSLQTQSGATGTPVLTDPPSQPATPHAPPHHICCITTPAAWSNEKRQPPLFEGQYRWALSLLRRPRGRPSGQFSPMIKIRRSSSGPVSCPRVQFGARQLRQANLRPHQRKRAARTRCPATT